MDCYATHQPLLVKHLLRSTGPVLELGIGDYSTPIIHEICAHQRREVWSFDSDSAWVERFSPYRTTSHHIERLADWSSLTPLAGGYGLVFVDHSPAERRIVDIRLLIPICDVMVVHDTEDCRYGYETVLPTLTEVETLKFWEVWSSAYKGCRS